MQRMCASVPDDASFAELSVAPTPNCSVMAYGARGDSRHLGRFLPDEQTCRVVAKTFCDEQAQTARCVASYAGGPSFWIAVEPAAAPEPSATAPDPTVQGDGDPAALAAEPAVRTAE
jgi:hypothetical protein